MSYCAHIFSLFFKGELRRKHFPIFAVESCMWTKAASLHRSQSVNQKFMLQMHFNVISAYILESVFFFFFTHERHVTFVLILRYKSGLSFASPRPRLMLFEIGNAPSVDHHHRAVLSLPLQPSWLLRAGLSSLQCCTSGIMKWRLKAHSMQDPLLPTSPLEQGTHPVGSSLNG